MSLLSSIPGIGFGNTAALQRAQKLQADKVLNANAMNAGKITAPQLTADPGSLVSGISKTKETGAPSFASMLNGMVDAVDAKNKASMQQTQDVMLGASDNLHQAMISMQEASVSFSLLVEVRNKLVESYKELTRMQV